MSAMVNFDLNLDNNVFTALNDKFNGDKIAINSFINNSIKKVIKPSKKMDTTDILLSDKKNRKELLQAIEDSKDLSKRIRIKIEDL
ncbi:MAG: hypothetical protein Ta2D_06290 [Rickettsiales bacterium]|nr:MAG: hypothetical protein Ta2D_06290 [Rickettsiales bacterium]